MMTVEVESSVVLLESRPIFFGALDGYRDSECKHDNIMVMGVIVKV